MGAIYTLRLLPAVPAIQSAGESDAAGSRDDVLDRVDHGMAA
jgi:hypothetical protein